MRVLADASAGRAELDVSVVARRNGSRASFSGCSPIQRSAAVLKEGVVIVRHIPFCLFAESSPPEYSCKST